MVKLKDFTHIYEPYVTSGFSIKTNTDSDDCDSQDIYELLYWR